jgi:hypothetical protein
MTDTPPTNLINQTILKDEASADKISDVKTIYGASYFSIFMRNFLAGFARSLGSVFIYLVFVGISAYFFFLFAWPQIQPFLKSYQNLMGAFSGSGGVSLDKLPRFDVAPTPNQSNPAPIQVDPTTIQQVIDQMKK